MQQCGARNAHAVLDAHPAAQQMMSFRSWLHTHASLVTSIELRAATADEQDMDQGPPEGPSINAALLLQQQALEAAAAALGTHAAAPVTVTAAAAAAGAVAAAEAARPSTTCHQQQQQQLVQRPCLQLASFSSEHLHRPALLAALPAHSLTALSLHLEHSSSAEDAATSAAFASMTKLKQLQLYDGVSDTAARGECLGALGQLPQLTSLKLGGFWSTLDQPLQQLLALPLPLRQLQLNPGEPDQLWACDDVSMTHLTSLTEFAATAWPVELMLQLPTQLQVLQLGRILTLDDSHFHALSRLQQLQRLSFTVVSNRWEPLQRLSQLTALQELALHYEAADVAAATAHVWHNLPHLRELSMSFKWYPATLQQLNTITMCAAAASSLTKLQLTGGSCYHGGADAFCMGNPDDDEIAGCPVSVCGSLAGLPLLRDLSTATRLPPRGGGWLSANENELQPCQLAALAALTGLTRLVLVNREGGFDSSDLDALAHRLTQLQELQLESRDGYTSRCMAAVGLMTQLTRLRLAGGWQAQWQNEASRKDLLLLSGLSRLQRLNLCSDEEVAAVVMGSLRASLPGARVRWRKWCGELGIAGENERRTASPLSTAQSLQLSWLQLLDDSIDFCLL